MKGFLTWHDQPFRKTHDLGEISRQCIAIDGSLEAVLGRAEPLTVYLARESDVVVAHGAPMA